MAEALYSLESLFDAALGDTKFDNEPVELSEKEKAKLNKQREKQKQKDEEAARMQAEIKETQANRRKFVTEEIKEEAKAFNYTNKNKEALEYQVVMENLQACRSRDERMDLEEKMFLIWSDIINNLTDPLKCCPDELIKIHPERFIRGYSEHQRFLFSHGMPLRPSYFMKDKDSEDQSFYPVWTDITNATVQLEFGCQVPSKRGADGERIPLGTEEKRYFAIRFYDEELGRFVHSMLIYERYEYEFEALLKKLTDFFNKIVSASRKKFDELKYALDKKAPGVFNRGKTTDQIKYLLNGYLKNGGSSTNIKTQKIARGTVVYFDKAAKYILVNSSHLKAAIVEPEEAVAAKISGFSKDASGRISTFIASHMALVEFKDKCITVVYGA